MARRITPEWLRAQNPVYASILDGDFDGEGLEMLTHAVAMRKKTMFRKGSKVRIVGSGDPQLDGREGLVLKVNSTRISVGVGEKQSWGGYEHEYGFPPRMLEVVQA